MMRFLLHDARPSAPAARPKAPDWLPPAALPLIALACRPTLPPWAFMWVLAFALFFACKWLTWHRAVRRLGGVPLCRSVGYLLGWPGMDAGAFLDPARTPPRPTAADWAEGCAKAAGGAVLLWGVTRLVPAERLVLRGWVGMVGLILLLHFGLFHLLALAWRRAGVDAEPIMDRPAASRSLGEFWGVRWNKGFHRLAADLCFRPLVRRAGPTASMLATFAVSGVVHDLVISLPAGAGFGLPTLYFLLQGAGVCLERSAAGRRAGLGRGVTGRLFAVAVTLGPAVLLFHRPFVLRVMLPFLAVVGAAN